MSDCWASLRTNKRMFRPPGLFHSSWNESVTETLRSLMWASCQRCKELLEESWCSFYQPRVLCVFQEKASLSPPLGLDWEEEMATAQPHDCVPVASNHPLYVLYTSGTTGTPKVQQQRQMEITANDSCKHICTQSSCRTSCKNFCLFDQQLMQNLDLLLGSSYLLL